MLERLANVIYYFFRIFGTFAFAGWVYLGLDDYKRYGTTNNLTEAAFVGLVIGFILYIIGWCIRYVLTGNKQL